MKMKEEEEEAFMDARYFDRCENAYFVRVGNEWIKEEEKEE